MLISDLLVLPQLATENANACMLFLDGFSFMLAIPGVCVPWSSMLHVKLVSLQSDSIVLGVVVLLL